MPEIYWLGTSNTGKDRAGAGFKPAAISSWLWGGGMHIVRRVREVCLHATSSDLDPKTYDFCSKLDDARRKRRVSDLQHENTLLLRALSETQSEIARLRKLLAD